MKLQQIIQKVQDKHSDVDKLFIHRFVMFLFEETKNEIKDTQNKEIIRLNRIGSFRKKYNRRERYEKYKEYKLMMDEINKNKQ